MINLPETIELLFLANNPIQPFRIDGYQQRINEIDKAFTNVSRIYLEIFRKPFFKKNIRTFGNVTVITVNQFLHPLTITNLLFRAKHIYIHSLLYLYRILPYFFLLPKNKQITLDLHGAIPEELDYYGEKFKSKLFLWLEYQTLRRCRNVVFVSRSFEEYYIKKYSFLREKKTFVLPNLTQSLTSFDSSKSHTELRNKFGISEDDVVFIYSGSTELWQNVELMMKKLQELVPLNPRYKAFLLTANLGEMKKIARKFELFPHPNVFILFAKPEELPSFYKFANYGFILREDHLLNKVSFPTKLFEYLYFGIIPIMKSTNVGDFPYWNCDFIYFDDLNASLTPAKSLKNTLIAKDLFKDFFNRIQELRQNVLDDSTVELKS
ncbi:MAG: hypothetical protein N2517_07405 [Ignavibacteria bacterium]|nr:hypothetical protein [Ignavibacteria bacterium]